MSTRLVNIVVDARDPAALGRFWSDALGWPIAVAARDPHSVAPFWIAASGWTVAQNEDDDVALRHPSGTGPFLEFLRRPGLTSHTTKNSIHLDVRPFATDGLDAEVDRLLSVGGTRVDVGQGDVSRMVLADPEGNELCVLTPRD